MYGHTTPMHCFLMHGGVNSSGGDMNTKVIVDIPKCLRGGAILEERHNAPLRRFYYLIIGWGLLATMAVLALIIVEVFHG